MQKSYTHLLEKRLQNQVFAVSADKLDVITSQVTIRLLSGVPLERNVEPTQHTSVETSSLPIIEVFDSLVAKGGAGSSGFTSYESIAGQLGYLVAAGHKDILMYIDSPGGEVSGLFALTSYMSSLKDKGITLTGITDGLCASAAYAIGSACSKLYATASSEVGSIGVITALVDVTKMDEEEGIKYTILRSKSDKALGNPHEAITDKIINKIEAKLSHYDEIFNNEVAKNRSSVSIESINNMKGNTFLGAEALSLNLIDGIIPSLQSFIENKSLASNKSSQQPKTRGITMSEMTMEAALAQIGSLSTELTSVKASLASAEQRGKQEEQQRILGILKAGDTFKMSLNDVQKDILTGASPEAAIGIYERIAEAKQVKQTPNTVTPQQAGAVAGATPRASAVTQGKTHWAKEYL